MQAIGGAEELHEHLCDVERKQAEESSRELAAISHPTPLRLYSQDSPTLYVKDVASLKDQQNRPLMTLIGPLQLRRRHNGSRRKGNPHSLLMLVPPHRPRWSVCYWVKCRRCRGTNGKQPLMDESTTFSHTKKQTHKEQVAFPLSTMQ